MHKTVSGSSCKNPSFQTQPASQGQFRGRLETRPAPPVYRPQQVGRPAVQQKPTAQFRIETRVAPPVYRPQQAGRPAVQQKPAAQSRIETRVAPPVYRPKAPVPAIQAMKTRSKSNLVVTRELPKGREQKVAFKRAMEDIANGKKILGHLPQEIQLEIQTLTKQLVNPYAKTGAIKKIVKGKKGKYIVSVW